MFTIDSNQTIRINRCDDSGNFTLFVNKGTAIEPIRHCFAYEFNCINPDTISVSIDKSIWRKKVTESGTYSFIYNLELNAWFLLGQQISLEDYGLTVVAEELKNGDTITILYHNFIEEVYFYVYEQNDDYCNYLLKKTFTTEGTIITNRRLRCMPPEEEIKYDQDTVSEDGDMILSLDAADTLHLKDNNYLYIIKAKLYDKDEDRYFINTVINAHNFYIINNGICR